MNTPVVTKIVLVSLPTPPNPERYSSRLTHFTSVVFDSNETSYKVSMPTGPDGTRTMTWIQKDWAIEIPCAQV